MKTGVDSSVLVAAVHANHPLHVVAADWLAARMSGDSLWVTHHAVLETYAVLTRLPGVLRTTGEEARKLIGETIRPHTQLASFDADSIWDLVDSMADQHIMSGRAYDAFQAAVLRANGIDAIATFNPRHFLDLPGDLNVIDPSRQGGANGI